MFELSQLPAVIQQQITQAKTPVEIVNNGQVVATVNPTVNAMMNFEKIPNSAYDYVMSLDMDERVADIEFDLPPRNKTLYPPEDLD